MAVGVCSGGTEICVDGAWGDCVEETTPGTEECEGAEDEDCDGSVDEGSACTVGATMACGEDEGACVAGTQTCGADGTWEACAGGVGPTDETCNDADDDCDGTVDEELTRTCGMSVGVCRMGVETCAAGTWGACSGGVEPSAETCDAARLDEDCDGSENEGCDCDEGDTRACSSGGCAGVETCDLAGAWGACVTGTVTETCNGLDDDCNGTVDDGAADCAAASGCRVQHRGGSTYLLCDAATRSWNDARDACASFGYHLVVIDDMGEQSYLQSQTSVVSSDQWWIGLRDVDDDSWYEDDEWDGGTSSYRRWRPGRPNQRGECAVLDNGDGGRWNNQPCDNPKRYVCEAP